MAHPTPMSSAPASGASLLYVRHRGRPRPLSARAERLLLVLMLIPDTDRMPPDVLADAALLSGPDVLADTMRELLAAGRVHAEPVPGGVHVTVVLPYR